MTVDTEIALIFAAAAAVIFLANAFSSGHHQDREPHSFGHLTEQREEDPRL